MKLLPCPFCGGNARKSVGTYGDGSDWRYIECESCSVMCDPTAWNLRFYSGYAKGQSDMREKLKLERDDLIKERDSLIKERDDKLTAIEKHNAAVAEMIKICENGRQWFAIRTLIQ